VIENPKVGQRVWWIPNHGPLERHLGTCYGGGHWTFGNGDPVDSSEIYFTPASAASALRAEAQRLIDAADKLESEASDGTTG
jgi:hypothetical protein